MNKRRYKVSLAVERVHEIRDFIQEVYQSHASLSSQERRQIGRVLKELTKALENSSSPSVWVKSDLVGEILEVFLTVYESVGANGKEN